LLHEALTAARGVGLALILGGVVGIFWSADGTLGSRENIGHILFLGAALLWACYTVAMRRARLDGLHAAAIAAVGTLALYLPFYAALAGASLFKAPPADVALQAFVQGVLAAVVALVLYGRAVSILGASGAAAFPALCPAMTAVLAIPVLGEWPTVVEWAAVILIWAGVYVLSGGPLAGFRWRSTQRSAGRPAGRPAPPRI
jgi:drug/metabolite transporter (DMT)-like permease